MSYSVQTPIIGKSTGTAAEALAWLDVAAGAETEYVAELWRLCGLTGLDAAVLFSQASHETGDFSSPVWQSRRNPAGIGWTGDPAQNAASQIWANGTDAARAHIIHMLTYTRGESLGTRIEPYAALDPRRQAVIDAGYAGTVRTLSGLTGRWAVDTRYAEKIAAKANLIFPNRPEVKPAMTTPPMYTLSADHARYGISLAEANEVMSHRFNRGGIKPQFIVLHIQAGYTKGSLDYWANAAQASSTVMIQHDGSILKVIPEEFGPWTNGDDNQPSANGARLVNLPGNSNLYTLSIEAEGIDGTDIQPAQLDSIVWQVEDWMRRYAIPKANVIRHGDINSVTRPNCPGAYYPIVMARIGTTPTPPPAPEYAKPKAPWPKGTLGWQSLNGTSVFALVAEVEVTSKSGVEPSFNASDSAKPTGPKLKQGTRYTVIGSFRDANGTPWNIDEFGSRLLASKSKPRLPAKP